MLDTGTHAANHCGPMTGKSSVIQTLFAWLLPLAVGVALGGGILAYSSGGLALPAYLPMALTTRVVTAGEAPALSPPQVAPQLSVRRKAPPAAVQTPPAAEVPTPDSAPVIPAPKAAPQPKAKLPTAAVPKPKPRPWQWTPLRDSVADYFRTHLPDIGAMPLVHLATICDDEEWVGRLLSGGVDPNEATPAGDTPLCAAIRLGASSAVRALLYGGADTAQVNFEKQPPLALASLRRGTESVRALLAAGADPNVRFTSPVVKSVLERVTIKDLRHYLEMDRGITPLIACASRGDVESATELLKAGAKPSLCTTRYKRYPINFAATQGYLFLMRILLGRQPESEPRVLVTVDLGKQRAWVTKEGQVIDSCVVSTGRAGYSTPAGRYVITDKHRSWTSTIYHVAMPFFMRLNCGAIGLHSGHVTGRPASHGCIRLPYEKARKFFELVRVGDEVEIIQ